MTKTNASAALVTESITTIFLVYMLVRLVCLFFLFFATCLINNCTSLSTAT